MTEPFVIRMVVCILGAVALAALAGVIGLAWYDKTIPEALTVTLGAALGAVGTLLTRTSTK